MTTSLPPTDVDEPAARRAAARKALLAKKLRNADSGQRTGIPNRPDTDQRVLSYQQERVWFMEQFAPGTSSYTIPIRVELTGPLDGDVLQRSLVALRSRHEVLRSRFPVDVDGNPTVTIDDADSPLPIDQVDADDEEAVEAAVFQASQVPFDLDTGPLMRVTLIRRSAQDHVLLICCHHIVGDGWSVDVLLRDLAGTYHAERAGVDPTLPNIAIDYADFAQWQRDTLSGAELDRQLTFWTDDLTGVPVLELPTDHPRPANQTFDGEFHEFLIPPEYTGRLNALATEHGATLFMTLLAAYQVLLSRHSGQDDFAVGSSSAGRTQAELENVVGMFINMLPMRAQLAGDPSFAEVLDRTRRQVLDAFDHADVPFERLVNNLGVPRDTSRSPVFQAMFVLQNYELGRMNSAGTSDLAMRWIPMELPATRFDIELHVVETTRGLRCKFVYNTALFDAATIERMAQRFETLLTSLVNRPDLPISQQELLPADERTLLAAWNDTIESAEVPVAETLTELIQQQVHRTPDAPAVTFDGTTWTYAELNRRANRVAHALRARGVGPESLVAVGVDRSFELVIALLGVLKSGGAYVPLDPEYPAERLQFMLADAQAPVALVSQEHAGLLAADSVFSDVLILDDTSWHSDDESDPEPVCGPENAAYVIYTSGSTGRPKGVPNRHRAVVNRLDWMQRTYQLDDSDSVLQKTPAGFDVSVWEFFWPLISGARLVLAEPGGHKDAAYLRDVVIDEGITTAHFVPSMLTLFLAGDGAERCTSLRRVICSGEELPVADARQFLDVLPHCDLHNLYGPTEAAIDVSSWPVTTAGLEGLSSVPIGAPIANITLHVLDPSGAPTPIGVAGELHIGGIGLAHGYHRRPALTAEKFVPDPFSTTPGARMYRTGDLARWRRDGTVDFLGRIDNQVKVRGLRIELGEIETALRDRPEVHDTAVIVREDTPGDKRLVGYVVGDPAGEPADQTEFFDAAELRAALKDSLPDYMVPTTFVGLDALPLTPNGKLDRAALPAPTLSRDAQAELIEPSTPVEHALATIWMEVLRIEELGVHDDFFDLGGHSLLATQVIAKIKQGDFDRAVGVMDLFANRTISDLAAFIGQGDNDGPRHLLYELSTPVPVEQRTMNYVCFPYGGGSAIVYQALADALPTGNRLFSVAIPGHDVGLDEDPVPFDDLVLRLAEEIMERVDGPLCLYGHCGVGNALAVAVALELEKRGRSVETLFIGAMFPFARLKGFIGTVRAGFERLRSNKHYADWLKGMGVDTEGIGPEQADRIISNMRTDSDAAEKYFSGLLDTNPEPLRAPVVSVVGSEDPVTDYYTERFQEWEFLTDRMALVVLDRAGHFFVKHRADELAEIITTIGDVPGADPDLVPGPDPEKGWALLDTYHCVPDDTATEIIKPSVGRFLAVTIGQMISTLGSALAGFAIPLWLYMQTGSVTDLGLLWALSLIFGVIVLPFAGTLIDRVNRRKILISASCSSAVIQIVLATSLYFNGTETWPLYVLIPLSSVARSFQGLAFQSSVPQLVPKQYLGHAMGLAQLSNGFAQLMMPVIAAGVLTVLGIVGVLAIVICAYIFAIIVLMSVRFPDMLGWRRREPLLTAILGGLRYSWNHRGFRAMIVYFGVANLFLGPALVLIAPLVLSFGTDTDVARIAMAEACGALAGAITMAVWGGPTQRRMRAVLMTNCGTGIGCIIMGVDASLVVIGVGMFLMAMAMSVSQTIYATIVQVKVPQRYHGRVFALNQTISWSTLPIGFAVLAPAATALLEPTMAEGGALAGSVGELIGVGEGRGIGLSYVMFGALMVMTIAIAACFRLLRHFDAEVPDSLPDDLVGAQERQQAMEQRRRDAVVASSGHETASRDATGQDTAEQSAAVLTKEGAP